VPEGEVEAYGYGCVLAMRGSQVAAIGHGGSDPGVAALLSHYRDDGTTIAVICNQDRGAFATTLAVAAALGVHDPRGPRPETATPA
jgi:hypothetical protein